MEQVIQLQVVEEICIRVRFTINKEPHGIGTYKHLGSQRTKDNRNKGKITKNSKLRLGQEKKHGWFVFRVDSARM